MSTGHFTLSAFLEEMVTACMPDAVLDLAESDEGLAIPQSKITRLISTRLVRLFGGQTLIYRSANGLSVYIEIQESLEEGILATVKGNAWLLEALVQALQTAYVALSATRYAVHNKYDPGKIIYAHIKYGVDEIVENILTNSPRNIRS